jgi:hypothetical protein
MIFFGPTADLSGLNLRQLDLDNMNLSSANLTGVDLSGSNLAGTDLSNAVLTGVKSRAIRGTASLPSGWVLANGTLIGAGVSATNLNLSGLNFEGSNLAGIDLRNSNLSGANLRNVDFSGANLRNANLSGADISGTNLNQTDLAGVVFADVIAQDVVGSPLNVPNGWAIQDGKFIGTVFLNPVSISGKLELEQQLTANVSSSPVNVEYVFTWFRNGVALEGSNGRTYQIGQADLGAKLSVRVSASKPNFLSASVTSGEVHVSNILSELQNLTLQGSAVKGGQLTLSFDGKVPFSTITYQVSRDGGSTWTNIGGALYNIQFTDLGGDLRFRVVQSAPGYVTQTTEFDAVAVEASYALPGFSMGSIDGANSGSSIQGGSKVGSVLKATKSTWTNGTRVTGFWWSSKGYSVSNKLTYKSMPQDIGADLVYMEVGVSPTGETKYRMSTSVNVLPNQFDNSSKPNLIGATTIGSRIKAAVSTSWSSGAKYFYQWLANGEIIPGATGVTYTVTADDVDSALSVRVCATKLSFAEKCEESLPTTIIGKSQINSSSKPTLKLTATRSGKLLSASLGKWLAGVTFKYEWLRDGEVMLGEDRATYSFKPEDNGHAMSLRVTASKAGYFDMTRTSDSKVYK